MDDIGESLYLARGYAWQIAWQDANQLDYLAKVEFYSLVSVWLFRWDKLSHFIPRLCFVVGNRVPCAIAVAHRLNRYPWDGFVHNVNNFSVTLMGAGVGSRQQSQRTLLRDAVKRLGHIESAADAVGCLAHGLVCDGHLILQYET